MDEQGSPVELLPLIATLKRWVKGPPLGKRKEGSDVAGPPLRGRDIPEGNRRKEYARSSRREQ